MSKIKVAPGVYETSQNTRIVVVEELDPTFDYADFDIGFMGTPEFDRKWRIREGGPEEIDHILESNSEGYLTDTSLEPNCTPDKDGWWPPQAGELIPFDWQTKGYKHMLTSFEVFRGPDYRHYHIVRGLAKTQERIDELYWLTSHAPVSLDADTQMFEFYPSGATKPVIVYLAGGRNYPYDKR